MVKFVWLKIWLSSKLKKLKWMSGGGVGWNFGGKNGKELVYFMFIQSFLSLCAWNLEHWKQRFLSFSSPFIHEFPHLFSHSFLFLTWLWWVEVVVFLFLLIFMFLDLDLVEFWASLAHGKACKWFFFQKPSDDPGSIYVFRVFLLRFLCINYLSQFM